jgi:hypothetical protein
MLIPKSTETAVAGVTVTRVDSVTSVPAELVTVKLYVVVARGAILIGVPLVTAMFPGVTIPVPFAKTPVRSAVPPAAMVAGLAAKLLIDGAAGTGVTSTLVVICAFATEFVTVSV